MGEPSLEGMDTEEILCAKDSLMESLDDLFKVPEIMACIDQEHREKTPLRVADMLFEMYRGCWQDPKEVLNITFNSRKYDEMVYVNDMSFASSCAHHMLPFMGKAYFAYMPGDKIVGLSKIPRLVEVLSKRPQVQEDLTVQIVDTFYEVLNPKGCGLVMEGIHLCMNIRGVENESAYSRTCALRGNFIEPSIKSEFLDGIRKVGTQLWP